MMEGEKANQSQWVVKTNPAKRRNSVKCTLKTKVVPKGGSSAALKLHRQLSSEKSPSMEPQDELAAIFQKRKARTEPNGIDASGGLAAAGDNENVSPVKAAKSRFETVHGSNNVNSNLGKPTAVKGPLPPKPVNASKGIGAVETKSKLSDIASKFGSANAANKNKESTDKTAAYGRQTSDLPLVSPTSKPISTIRSSPNIFGSGSEVHGTISEEKNVDDTVSSSQNIKALRDNLFLTIEHSKRLSSGGSSPGSASPGIVMRSRSPTPGVVEITNTPPTLRKKSPTFPPKPGQVGPPGGEQSKSEPGSKRSSSTSSDKSDDRIGEKFVAALKKAGFKSPESNGAVPLAKEVESSTLPLPPKPNKPVRKPKLAKSITSTNQASPRSPALPPKLVKPTDAASVNKIILNEINNSVTPVLPARTKKVPPLPKTNTEINSSKKAKQEPPSPRKKSPIGGVKLIDDLSRPIPPIKPTVTQQLSTGSDYYEDVEVMDYPPPEGDKDSGRGSTEGGIADAEKRSSGGGKLVLSITSTPVFSDGSRARHCGIPAHFQRMPHRHESCAALCPSENLNSALVLFVTQRQ